MSNVSPPLNVEPLSYAGPSAGGRTNVWAGLAIALVGLVLLFFGGCFCVGILIHLSATPAINGSPGPWSSGDYVFHLLMYALAIAFFVSGALLVVRGVTALFRILSTSHP